MTFTQFLRESKEQLDISIQPASKWLTSEKKKEYFLTTPCKIEAKTDGVKLTILKIDDTGDYTKDYIFAYKGNILYTSEFDYTSNYKTKKESVGSSQFKLVFEHFSKLPKNSIPVNTELFVEFLMKKSTLSSNYEKPHGMVLIASTKSSYEANFGKLKTKPSGFDISKRNDYAKQLKLNTPMFLFEGVMISKKTFESGIKNPQLKQIFTQDQSAINWDDYDSIISNISHMLLKVESAFGGVEEGVVIQFPDVLLKIQQEYQVDQAARAAIKNNYRDTPENEDIYWRNVKLASFEIQKMMTTKNVSLDVKLSELAQILKNYKPVFEHPKKTVSNIKDDIQITTKTQIIKNMKGNNNALFFGKYRVLTKAHYLIIKRGLDLYDNVVVGLVSSKDTTDTYKLRLKMLQKSFPEIDIIEANNGNILALLRKSPKNINVVIAGTDRVDSYRKQLEKTDLVVKEIPRVAGDISASKVIEKINDFEFFKKNTPKQIHDMYNEILKTYNKE